MFAVKGNVPYTLFIVDFVSIVWHYNNYFALIFMREKISNFGYTIIEFNILQTLVG